jgi:hypothetical protein
MIKRNAPVVAPVCVTRVKKSEFPTPTAGLPLLKHLSSRPIPIRINRIFPVQSLLTESAARLTNKEVP